MTKSGLKASGARSALTISKSLSLSSAVTPPGYYKYPIGDWKAYLATAKKRFNIDFPKRWIQTKTLNDFIPIKTLGAGSYGKVILVRMREPEGRLLAMKVLDKAAAVKSQDVECLLNERRVLAALVFPFTVSLVQFFMDRVNLYFVMPFIMGGEMFALIRKSIKFSEIQTRFYAAQVLLALEYMHYHELMHRDIKPENILLDGEGYIKLTDFGFTKHIDGRTFTICGTPEYMAPEILRNHGYSYSADWWAFGVLIYEMSVGSPPFEAGSNSELHALIVKERYAMPKSLSPPLRDVIKAMLKGFWNHCAQVNISERLGCMKGGVNELKKSIFFHGIQWIDLVNRRIKPPYIPRIANDGDYSMFSVPKDEALIHLPTDDGTKNDVVSFHFKDF